MNVTSGNNRTTLHNTIRNTQQLYKRFNRRFNTTINPSERTFLKQEINCCCATLKKCATQWKNAGYGGSTWITSGYTPCTLNAIGVWKNVPGSRVTGYGSRSNASRSSRTTNHKGGRKSTPTTSRRSGTHSSRRSRTTSFFSKNGRRAFSFAN